MRILVTNDDGIHAPGIAHLTRVAKHLGEVIVVAPDRERSACGHSMTMRDPLRVVETTLEDCRALVVNGVPVDCVNVGLTVAWPDGCDLVLSGINNGPNLGIDTTYSGTVAAAMEASINGIRGIATSMCVFADGAPFHYETGERWLIDNMEVLLQLELPAMTLINVNVPAIAHDEIKGMRFSATGSRIYEDRVERRDDPWGRPYYWQGGSVVMRAEDPESDVWAVTNGFVSVTPLKVDWTDRSLIERWSAAWVSARL